MSDLFEPLPESAATRRKENTRTRLVRASLDVFVDTGIDRATVDDLVRAAGFTRGAFYSNFSTKEEVFIELFDEVTTELIGIAQSSVRRSVEESTASTADPADLADVDLMLAVFEGIRPFGRQWYLLYSEAIVRSLRDEQMRTELAVQLRRMRDEIGQLLTARLELAGGRSLLEPGDLAQLLIGIFIDLMMREQMEHRDVTALAATTIVGTLNAFVEPREDTPHDHRTP